MPWTRFRPLKQFGKYNTRIFKYMLKARNLRDKPIIRTHPDLIAAGVPIYDPLEPNFFKQLRNEQDFQALQKPRHLHKPTDEDHPLYKPEKCFLFDGTQELMDGIDEACAMIKATKAQPIPEKVYGSLPPDFLPADFEQQVADSIMHGEAYDGTLEKLPRRHDPILFWVVQPALYGIPLLRRSQVILADLYRKVALISASKDKSMLDLRCDRNAPISGYLSGQSSGFGAPLVLRQQPYMTVQGKRPLSPLVTATEIEATRKQQVPDIYPISPLVDLREECIYNDTALLPRQIIADLHVNAVFSSRVQDQKYPWTQEQNAANTVLLAFGAALAQATRNNVNDFAEDSSSKPLEPVTVKAAQLVNGKLDMAIVQLNTLDLNTEKKEDTSIKNMVWVEKAAPLYTPKPFFESTTEVGDLNLDTVNKFASFVLYR